MEIKCSNTIVLVGDQTISVLLLFNLLDDERGYGDIAFVKHFAPDLPSISSSVVSSSLEQMLKTLTSISVTGEREDKEEGRAREKRGERVGQRLQGTYSEIKNIFEQLGVIE